MTNLFLKVSKDLFNIGLNPVEILLVSQIAEFQTNTGDCFISDKTLAENFGVSESTIKREIKKLEELGIIKRETKNVKGGKERHMSVDFTSIKMSLDSSKKSESKDSQSSNCSLTSVKMSFDKGQIDTIKDKSQDKERDNISEIFQPTAERISLGTAQGAVLQKPVSELTEREKMERFKKEFGF